MKQTTRRPAASIQAQGDPNPPLSGRRAQRRALKERTLPIHAALLVALSLTLAPTHGLAETVADLNIPFRAGYGTTPNKYAENSVNQGLKDLKAGVRAARAAWRFANSWRENEEKCQGEPGCEATAFALDFACMVTSAAGYGAFTSLSLAYPPIGIPMTMLHLAFFGTGNPFCMDYAGGEYSTGGLICCKYTPEQQGCHTAFPGGFPNCQLNPLYLDTAQSFGACMVPSNGIGCSCPQPECSDTYATASDEGDFPEAAAADDEEAARTENFRRTQWLNSIVVALVTKVLSASSSEASAQAGLSMALFQGMMGFMLHLENEGVFEMMRIDPYEPIDDERTLEANKSMFGTAALRVMFAVPNSLERYDYAASYGWSDDAIEDYLDGVDPDVELSRWLSPFGLEILKESLPVRWPLMAVPYPGEGASDKDELLDWEDAAVVGTPPEIAALELNVAGPGATLTIEVDDPEDGVMPGALVLCRINWGDNTLTHGACEQGQANAFDHSYRRAGEYGISVSYMNSAGLTDDDEVSVMIPEGGPTALNPPWLEGVGLVATVTTQNPSVVDIVGIDETGESYHLMSTWSGSKDDGGFFGGGGLFGGGDESDDIEPLDDEALENTAYGLTLESVQIVLHDPTGEGGTLFAQSLQLAPFRSDGSEVAPITLTLSVGHMIAVAGAAPYWSADENAVALEITEGAIYEISLPCQAMECDLDPIWGVSCGSCPAGDTCGEGLCHTLPGENADPDSPSAPDAYGGNVPTDQDKPGKKGKPAGSGHKGSWATGGPNGP